MVDQSPSSASSLASERETPDVGRVECEREMELSGVKRPKILSAPCAEVRGGNTRGGERDVLRGMDGMKGEEVGERGALDSVGEFSRIGDKIVD